MAEEQPTAQSAQRRGGKPRRFTPDQERQITADYESGMTSRDAGLKWSVQGCVVLDIVRRNGSTIRRPRNWDFMTDEQQQEIIAAYRDDVKVTDIAARFGTSVSYVKKVIRTHNEPLRGHRTTRTLNHSYFREITTEAQAWLLGLIATDGCVTDKTLMFGLKREDRPVLLRVRDMLDSDAEVVDYTARIGEKGYPATRFAVYSPEMIADLLRHGIHPNKTKTVRFWGGPDELLRHYARGLVDGDGSIFRDGQKKWHLDYLGNEHIATGFAVYVERKTGIKPGLLELDPERGLYVKYWRQSEVQTVVRFLYEGSTEHLPRKKTLADIVISSTFQVYFDWSEMTRERAEAIVEQLGWMDGATSIGVSVVKFKNYVNRQRRLARGIKC